MMTLSATPIQLGDSVYVDCSASSVALKAVQNKFKGRVGVVVKVFDYVRGSRLDDPTNVEVEFARVGRKAEVTVELTKQILINIGR